MLGRHRLEDERQESFSDVDLASTDRDAHSRQTLKMKVMTLEPGLGRSNVTADCRPRGAELPLEVGYVNGARRRVEQRGEDLKLAVIAIENPGPGRSAKTHQDRTAALSIPGHPYTNPAASHDSEALGPEECLDRWKVVPDDATRQL